MKLELGFCLVEFPSPIIEFDEFRIGFERVSVPYLPEGICPNLFLKFRSLFFGGYDKESGVRYVFADLKLP